MVQGTPEVSAVPQTGRPQDTTRAGKGEVVGLKTPRETARTHRLIEGSPGHPGGPPKEGTPNRLGSPAILTRFSRFRGTVQQGPVQRQEAQIVQSCK